MNFKIDSQSIEDDVIRIQSRSMSDPTLSDIDFKNKMALAYTTVKQIGIIRMYMVVGVFTHFSSSQKPWYFVYLSIEFKISTNTSLYKSADFA